MSDTICKYEKGTPKVDRNAINIGVVCQGTQYATMVTKLLSSYCGVYYYVLQRIKYWRLNETWLTNYSGRAAVFYLTGSTEKYWWFLKQIIPISDRSWEVCIGQLYISWFITCLNTYSSLCYWFYLLFLHFSALFSFYTSEIQVS